MTTDHTRLTTTIATGEPRMTAMPDHAPETASAKGHRQLGNCLHIGNMLLRMVIHKQDIRSL